MALESQSPGCDSGNGSDPAGRLRGRAATTLREMCTASLLSVAELAKQLQTATGEFVSPDQLGAWEQGEEEFSAWVLPAMVDVCGLRRDGDNWVLRGQQSSFPRAAETGASESPDQSKLRYQVQAATALRDACTASGLSTRELEEALRGVAGYSIRAQELDSWLLGGSDFPSWILFAMTELRGPVPAHDRRRTRMPEDDDALGIVSRLEDPAARRTRSVAAVLAMMAGLAGAAIGIVLLTSHLGPADRGDVARANSAGPVSGQPQQPTPGSSPTMTVTPGAASASPAVQPQSQPGGAPPESSTANQPLATPGRAAVTQPSPGPAKSAAGPATTSAAAPTTPPSPQGGASSNSSNSSGGLIDGLVNGVVGLLGL